MQQRGILRPASATAQIPAVLLRSGAERASPTALLLLAVLVGVVSASVPAAVLDRPQGAGLLVGASAALYGLTAVCPVILTYLVVDQLTGDDELGRLRDLYLQGVDLRVPRAGAVLAAGRDWVRFAVLAVLTGALVGLGDGLRVGGRPSFGAWAAAPGTLLAVQFYVLFLAVFWGSIFRRAPAALLGGAVLPVLALGLIPLLRDSWTLTLVKATPMAPL